MKLQSHLPGLLLAFVALSGTALLHAQSVIQFSASTYNVTEGTPEVAIVVQRTNDLGTVVSVDFIAITDWTLWFLNKYLKGSNDPMPRTADYPQIFNFKQK